MKQTENIKRKRRRSTSTSSLPLNLALEIFSKLPVKSILRFRCVSKFWSSIITEPIFTKSFQTKARLLLFCKEGDEFFVFSFPQHTGPATPIVWNPSTRKFLPLPKPDKTWKDITVFLGYDPVQCKQKVVCMCLWTMHQRVLYYRAEIGSYRVIMSFNVRLEIFNMITTQWDTYWRMMMIAYHGKLACVGSSWNSISLWVLEDAEKQEWSNHIFLLLSHYDQGLQNFHYKKNTVLQRPKSCRKNNLHRLIMAE
ncbi:hypothetical protein EUTSA_v10015925mg [Eutrema salsugineum]|uniref:F-box domain-containing protein n=1 Tax=Eutrema salsugineum TaxID=72664 RepID=V4NBX5_EUTSA|nr:hypothetical protein EUTSA_v10015925mg [Eutrema salsugineum]